MKIKLVLFFVVVSAVVLFAPNLVRAQGAADAFAKYTSPHDICNYYRTRADFVVERESDNECLVSLGTGKYKTFTQYYYSKNSWCYKVIQEGKTVYGNCVPIPSKSVDFTQYTPYIIGGVVVFIFLITLSSIPKPPLNPVQPQPTAPAESTKVFRQPQPVRSKVLRPKKKTRIWPELSRWLKFRRKK